MPQLLARLCTLDLLLRAVRGTGRPSVVLTTSSRETMMERPFTVAWLCLEPRCLTIPDSLPARLLKRLPLRNAGGRVSAQAMARLRGRRGLVVVGTPLLVLPRRCLCRNVRLLVRAADGLKPRSLVLPCGMPPGGRWTSPVPPSSRCRLAPLSVSTTRGASRARRRRTGPMCACHPVRLPPIRRTLLGLPWQ